MAIFTSTLNPTPFGVFDSDSAFQGDADAMITFVKRKLGDDILSVELTSKQVWMCFEEATFEYGKYINEYMTKSQLNNLMGAATGSLSGSEGRFPRETQEFLMRKAEPYAAHAGIGGSYNTMSGSIVLTGSQQDYDIYTDLKNPDTDTALYDEQPAGTATKLRVFDVYHFSNQSAYRFFDTTSAINYLNNEFSFESFTPETVFYVLPVFEDVLRQQQMDISNRVRRSNYSYELVGTKLRIFPRPTSSNSGQKLWIRVGYAMDGLNPAYTDVTIDGVSGPQNVPFGNIMYENINSMGRQWIRQYTVALSKEVLGQVRGKFSSVPIPNGDLQLNGSELLAQSSTEKEKLKSDLREMLDGLTYDKMLEGQAVEAENMTRILKLIPIPFGKAIMIG
tara:strand:+ start:2037 stop:3212 length:1176 start_codon:yes stop_codon:yes gene_type:complete